jgi:hypothetical protein
VNTKSFIERLRAQSVRRTNQVQLRFRSHEMYVHYKIAPLVMELWKCEFNVRRAEVNEQEITFNLYFGTQFCAYVFSHIAKQYASVYDEKNNMVGGIWLDLRHITALCELVEWYDDTVIRLYK